MILERLFLYPWETTYSSPPVLPPQLPAHLHILGLCEDLEQLVIRQEVEAREAHALGLQVVLEVLLDLLQGLIGTLEDLRESRVDYRVRRQWGIRR